MTYYLPSLTVLLIFACLVAYDYIRDLRRELKNEKATTKSLMKAYEHQYREICDLKGKPQPPPEYFGHDSPKQEPAYDEGFAPRFIGPNAIRQREMFDEQRGKEKSAVTLDITGRNPSPNAIAEAARQAADNGEF